ncbi:cell division protein FtsQ/DivIB [Mesonia sp. K7]|uniref:cell division protein FtsQ/DivIB n=1 Tax=Mesonia sp. K7 TaxID=2218606 RepID=UPI000DA7AA45|nr:hypothetical protein [Mesonia sp. K7]PZD78018.1 hypothetical protein DNG35_06460 [Mesonia sp. K7]
MKKFKELFFFLVLLGVIAFLYSFSVKRNAKKPIAEIAIEFTNGDNLYINELDVNNLLIQNKTEFKNQSKDVLDLNELERKLEKNPMIYDAEVYIDVEGKLGAIITQRQPVARVFGEQGFYIDTHGEKMPLSENYAARVPLVKNVSEKQMMAIHPFLMKIQEDEFLKKEVIAMSIEKNNELVLLLRDYDFEVFFGKLQQIDEKVEKLKVFCQNYSQQPVKVAYDKISLKYKNQVVGTRK